MGKPWNWGFCWNHFIPRRTCQWKKERQGNGLKFSHLSCVLKWQYISFLHDSLILGGCTFWSDLKSATGRLPWKHDISLKIAVIIWLYSNSFLKTEQFSAKHSLRFSLSWLWRQLASYDIYYFWSNAGFIMFPKITLGRRK